MGFFFRATRFGGKWTSGCPTGQPQKLLVLSVVYREGGGWGYGTRRRKKTNNQKQNGTINKLQEGYSAIVALQCIQQV